VRLATAESAVSTGMNVRVTNVAGISGRRPDTDSPPMDGRKPRASGSIAWAISTLRDQGMPSEEIAMILGTAEPLMVHRYLELHRERLEEQLGEQRRTLGRLEELLTARSIEATALSLEERGRSARLDLKHRPADSNPSGCQPGLQTGSCSCRSPPIGLRGARRQGSGVR
jgi:hypothetical protein